MAFPPISSRKKERGGCVCGPSSICRVHERRERRRVTAYPPFTRSVETLTVPTLPPSPPLPSPPLSLLVYTRFHQFHYRPLLNNKPDLTHSLPFFSLSAVPLFFVFCFLPFLFLFGTFWPDLSSFSLCVVLCVVCLCATCVCVFKGGEEYGGATKIDAYSN